MRRRRNGEWSQNVLTPMVLGDLPSPFEQHLQEHVAAGGEVLGLGVFQLVVADALLAGHTKTMG